MTTIDKRLQQLEQSADSGHKVRLILLSSLGSTDEQQTHIRLPSGEVLIRAQGEALQDFQDRAGDCAEAASPGLIGFGVLGGDELQEVCQ